MVFHDFPDLGADGMGADDTAMGFMINMCPPVAHLVAL